jgi:hypothetical protein
VALDSTLVSTLIAIAAGAIGSLLSWIIASSKNNNELEKQDIRIMGAISSLETRLVELKGDFKEFVKESRLENRELEIKIEESDRRFRSLTGFLSSKGLHYRTRSNEKETLS